MAEPLTKTIKISEWTYRQLNRMGSKGETFDRIIKRLIVQAKFLQKRERRETRDGERYS